MVTVRSIVTAPFRAVWFLVTLPFLLLFWLLSLVKACLLAIVRLPLYYLGRARRRVAVAWEWTKKRGRALPWWGGTCVKASQSTQTLEEDEDEDVYSTPLPLSRPSSGHFTTASLRQRAPLLNQELLLKLQREARKRSTSQARRREIAAILAVFLQPESPLSSPGESEREEEEERDIGASGPVIQDENSLRLILELMSLSNTAEDSRDKDEEESRRRKARELASVYNYDRGKLQELISELETVSFDISSSHKKSKRVGRKESSRHSRVRQRSHRSSQSPLSHSRSRHSTGSRPSPPSHYSDTESDDDACVTAEDGFSDEEEEPHTSEYHSPPEDLSYSEEEEEEEEERGRAAKRVRSKTQQDGGKSRRPPRVVKSVAEVRETPVAVVASDPPPEERPRLGSERLSSYTGVLSPVHESPEYARTPSDPDSAAELENDLNQALLQLNSEASGLQADAREVEAIEQKVAQLSEASLSASPSPFPSGAPQTPNTVMWEKGKCVEISSSETAKEEGGKGGKENETDGKEGERGEGSKKEKEEEGEGGKERGSDFAAIPKTEPSLGLKEGHDRQQLAVARSSARRRPPSRHTSTQSESGGSMAGEMMAVDPEMELLEKQLQQSVDSLSTLLEKKEKGGGKREGAKVEKEGGEKEEGEEEGGESGSEGEDDQSEGDFLERRLSGGGPSLTDQMSLLSPGSLRLTARDLSPESALEDSTNSNTDPPLAGPQTPGGTTPDSAHPPFSSSSRRVVTSTSSSPGAPLLEERGARPRSHSCDSQRRSGLGSSPKDKPLMIPSSIPPWLEMRKVAAAPLEPMPPKPPVHTFTPLHPRTRASSHPPINDPLTTKPTSTPREEEEEEEQSATAIDDDIYDTLSPVDERIYDVTPVRYLHQTVGSPVVESRKPRQEEEVEEEKKEEKKSRGSGEKTHSSTRGRDREGRGREKERRRDKDGERGKEKERRHRSHSGERSDTHQSSRHHDRDRERERDRDRGRHSSRHHSSSTDRHGRSKDTSSSSSRKHGSSSKSEHRKEESSSKHLSSKEREKGREKEEEKEKDKSILKGLRFSFRSKSEKSDSSGGKSSKGERERSSRSSGRSSRHRHHREDEEGEGTLHRTPSRLSVVSTSAISSPKEKHPDAIKKATSLSSLSISGSSQGSPILSPDDTRDVLV